jgi:hypothetical protein
MAATGAMGSLLQSLGSLPTRTPASTWLRSSSRWGVRWRRLLRCLGVLTPSSQDWTLRSTSSPGSVLGVEDDLRTLSPRLADEITSQPPLVEGL